jgi:CheY-like chemotaxis protein
MSIRIACREMAAARANSTRPTELIAHARRLEDFGRVLDDNLADTEREAAGARRLLAVAERDISLAFDQFSNRLANGHADCGVEVKNAETLAREIDQLKDQQIAATRRSGSIGVDSMQARARKLKEEIGPSLAGAKALAENVLRPRPMVMVVEDDEYARRLVARTLDPLVWDSVFACDGVEALSHLRRLRPDVILMDIRLPGLDGVSLTQRLKSAPHLASIPVIIMTGDARKETLASSMAAGAVAFVVKPFTRELLTAKLEKVLAR